MIVRDLVDLMKDWFPLHLAEHWDNVGLLLGDENAPLRRVMTTLTLTNASAEEAVREQVDLVVSHHPIFFRKVSRLTAHGADQAAYRLAQAGISLYSPHTAFDGGVLGINDQWCRLLALTDVAPLVRAAGNPRCKLVVFVPASDLEPVSQAMFAAGAGEIGEYRHCSYRSPGTGTFLGSENSNPTLGQKGRQQEVEEFRLEVLLPTYRLDQVVRAMRAAHSYEEPAFDIYPLTAPNDDVGAGRQGTLSTPTPLNQLATLAADAVGARHVEIVGPAEAVCHRVAIGCGSAGDLLSAAGRAGCDVFITGEARFHDYLEAQRLGIHLILVGHYASERFALDQLALRLQKHLPSLRVWASSAESDPSQIILRP